MLLRCQTAVDNPVLCGHSVGRNVNDCCLQPLVVLLVSVQLDDCWGHLPMAETIQRLSQEQNEISDQADDTNDGQGTLSIDQLDYMADLVAELREMSQRSGLTTLAAILALAQIEAGQQIAKRRGG